MRGPRTAHWAVAALVVVAVAGYATADAFDVVPGVLTLTPGSAATAATTPTSADPQPVAAAPVLGAVSREAPVPTSAGVARALGPMLDDAVLGPGASATVVDALTGQVLLDRGAARAHVPASTTKLLTGAAVLTTVGGDTQLVTRVVQGPTPDEVVLVGGGDVLLGTGPSQLEQTVGHAGLATLAEQVATALRAQGRSDVAVRFDDSMFEGPAVSPHWAPLDLRYGYTGPVAALGLARDHPVERHPAVADPASAAADAFVTALRQHGIAVSGPVVRTRATADAKVLGEVRSAPVAEILAMALTDSDNVLAEVLARLTARAMGRAPTFEDSAIAVLDQVQRLGVDVGPAHIVDGSGLGAGSVVPPRVLADLLRLAASDREPRLRPLLAGLPVSGFTGTLADRFGKAPAHGAAGVVRAKTGTLTGVSNLAGVTVDHDGRLLVVVLMADRVPPSGTLRARVQLDRVAAVLTACGCR